MKFFIFLLICVSFSAFGQIIFDRTKHDFGPLMSYDDRFVDFKLTNKGAKKGFVLRVVKSSEVVYLARSNSMEIDSSIYLRFQVNPRSKGRFSYEIEVFTSDRQEPVKLKLTGELKEEPPSSGFLTACPDFTARPGGRAYHFDLTVVTIDKETRKELEQTEVTLLQNGVPQWTTATDKSGSIRKDATLGFIYLYASHAGYKPVEMGAYVNFQRNKVLLELASIPNELIAKDTLANPSEWRSESDSSISVVPYDPAAKSDTSSFSESMYKPLNVVFVLDVSASMNQGDKIELMKFSLLQLTGLLRPCDHMGIVTYSDFANVLVPPSTGASRSELQTQIGALKASGLTAGGTGIKMGYKEVLKNLKADQLNTVIVVTDGAFNKDSENYVKTIKKYRKKGIELDIVGIKMKKTDQVKMEEVCSLGGGQLITIDSLSDAKTNLISQIRMRTFLKE
jgi:Ca-activated chloride channel family protein